MYRNNLHYVYIKDILNRQKGIYITAQQMKELDTSSSHGNFDLNKTT